MLPSIKLVLVGDGAVGKTTLCISHTTKKFPTNYTPNVFDGYAINLQFGSETWSFGIFDTIGEAYYDRLRPLSYLQANVFLVCFSVAMPGSLQNTQQKWFPELQYHCPGVPCIMVATQIDLRSDAEVVERMARLGQQPVDTLQGQKMAWQLGAANYFECSAKTREGVSKVFDEAIAAAFTHATRKDHKGICNLKTFAPMHLHSSNIRVSLATAAFAECVFVH
ncbi:GTP binding protein Cdc42 [Mycena galopus ATCC 62051]|nr:GTP binding protein Cdc42 [Mycena galopus ATCC 62051]